MIDASDDAVAIALHNVLTDYGWNVTTQPARLRAALNDQLAGSGADHRGAVDALVVAAEEGVAAKVRTAPPDDRSAQAAHIAQLMDWGLSQQAAAWAVGTWTSVVPRAGTGAVTAPVWQTPPVGGATVPDSAPPAYLDPTALPPAGAQWAPPAGATWAPHAGTQWAPAPPGTPGTPDATQMGRLWVPPTELPPGAWPSATTPTPSTSRRRTMIITAVLVAALGIGVGAYFVFGGNDKSTPHLSLDGRTVDKPDVVLAATESIVKGIVDERHGVATRDTRCYFARPKSTKSDNPSIETSVYCGPVLFVDGVPGQEYLQFALKSETNRSGVTV
jgi:hypothetical protein